jgi:hypothetical protein
MQWKTPKPELKELATSKNILQKQLQTKPSVQELSQVFEKFPHGKGDGSFTMSILTSARFPPFEREFLRVSPTHERDLCEEGMLYIPPCDDLWKQSSQLHKIQHKQWSIDRFCLGKVASEKAMRGWSTTCIEQTQSWNCSMFCFPMLWCFLPCRFFPLHSRR